MSEQFTDCLEADDWKNAAAIVGLIRFFDYAQIPYNRDEIFQAKEVYEDASEYCDGLDMLKFNAVDIAEEKLADFIEDYFFEDMHHCYVETALSKEEWSADEIDAINKRLTANTVMKKIFSIQKFDGTNRSEILTAIQKNRMSIINETYRNKTNLYRNFCNENLFRRSQGDALRLKGYYIDFAKKGKSVSYRYNPKLFRSSDSPYYDFIPFAFTISEESFFINDNSTIKRLFRTNQRLQDACRKQAEDQPYGVRDTRKALFENIIYAADFIDFDVEIIKKDRNKDYFETLYLRRVSIDIFKKIKNYQLFCRTVNLGKGPVPIQEEVTEAISNLRLMDDLIDALLKLDVNEERANHTVLAGSVIRLNALIRSKLYDGGENMNRAMRSAYASAKEAANILEKRNQRNKIRSYRTKLLSALVFHDYNRFSEILLNLSNFTDVYFPFAYDLFENFEANKEAAYTFVNNFNEYSRAREEAEDTYDEL